MVSPAQVSSLERRLDVYRALLRRDGSVSELSRLVTLLESELKDPDAAPAPQAPAQERSDH